MRASARVGMALAVAGTASGLTLMTGGAVAQAATTARHEAAVTCRYEVAPRIGLDVRSGPGVQYWKVGALTYRTHVSADCKDSGWTQLRGSVPNDLLGKWVDRRYLRPIPPSGGVGAGGGGTSVASDPLLAGAGAAIILMGGGVAIAARRRRAKGVC